MKKGFTLIELLVTISIIGIITAALFVGRTDEEQELALERSALQITQDLRETQEMTRNSERIECSYYGTQSNSFGIYFNTNQEKQYIIFADCNGDRERDSHDEDVAVRSLQGDAILGSITGGGQGNVVFESPRPTVYINGNDWGEEIEIDLIIESSFVGRTVKINSAGRIETLTK